MSNRFEKRRGGFLDMAISAHKKAKTFLDDVDRFIYWRPIDNLLKKKLGKSKDAAGNPAYPPLCMFKVLLLQRWYNLSDQGMDDALGESNQVIIKMLRGYLLIICANKPSPTWPP